MLEEHPDIVAFHEDLAQLLAKLREQVETYLEGFQKYNYMREVLLLFFILLFVGCYSYSFPMQQDLHATFSKFLATNPTLQNFEEKLDEFQVLDKEIATIESFAQIGAISLCTDSLKYALKNEVAQWRALYLFIFILQIVIINIFEPDEIYYQSEGQNEGEDTNNYGLHRRFGKENGN